MASSVYSSYSIHSCCSYSRRAVLSGDGVLLFPDLYFALKFLYALLRRVEGGCIISSSTDFANGRVIFGFSCYTSPFPLLLKSVKSFRGEECPIVFAGDWSSSSGNKFLSLA